MCSIGWRAGSKEVNMDWGPRQATSGALVEEVLSCLGEVLDRASEDLDGDTPLLELGLESFTAVRLRRRLREDIGLDLPLTAFLAGATARTVAAGDAEPASATTSPHEADDETFPLTPVQAAYLVGRDPSFPLVLQGQMYGRASLTCDDASPVFPATRHFSSI
jgi:aryl carrier-like protein